MRLVVLAAFMGFGLWAVSSSSKGSDRLVFLFLRTSSPASKEAGQALAAELTELRKSGVRFKVLFPYSGDTSLGGAWFLKRVGLDVPTAADPSGALAKSMNVKRVPFAVVFDSEGRELARCGLGDAAAELIRTLRGARPAGPTGSLRGTSALVTERPIPSRPNFGEHVAPILKSRCVPCHRTGGVSPFSLQDYASARKWAPMIEQATQSRKMPPWKAVSGFGEFFDGMALSESESATIRTWVRQGCAEGSPTPRLEVASETEWKLGPPNLILRPDRPYNVPIGGSDEYRYFVLRPSLPRPVYVTAIDVRPGNARVVHHVIAFVDSQGEADTIEAENKDGQVGYGDLGYPGFVPELALGGWAPGLEARTLPNSTGFELKPGWRIVIQVHYVPSGKPDQDQTELALYYSAVEPKALMRTAGYMASGERIPAGASAHLVEGSFLIEDSISIYAVMPHMHLLAKSMHAEIISPSGEKRPLVLVDNWDFGWQFIYWLRRPVQVSRGSRLLVEAVYDNSAANPKNPYSPPRSIRWGEKTTNEMCLLGVMYTAAKK